MILEWLHIYSYVSTLFAPLLTVISFITLIHNLFMERRKSQNISDALAYFMRESGLETPLLQHRAVEGWQEVVKPEIAGRTRALRIQNQCLVVETDSPSLCAYLSMYRTELVRRLNHRAGGSVIQEIRFIARS